MSLKGKILKAFMYGFDAKGKLAGMTAEEMHRYSVPEPPQSVREKHQTEKIEIGGTAAYWLSKEKASKGVLIYLHGGAYVVGPISMQWDYISKMSQRTEMAALVIDYRQLPDHPFPAALEDVVKVVTTLQEQGELPGNWYFLGDSAGGGLALSSSYKLREEGADLPTKFVLMSPWLDVSMTNPALERTANDDPFLSRGMEKAVGGYAPKSELKNPLLSPMYGEVKGLPPMLLQTGTNEMLLWDARKFYLKCLESEVEIQYEEYEEMFHAFMIVTLLREAKQALDKQVEFLLAEVPEPRED